QTVYWNIDFANGYSLLATLLATVGILGFASLVLFLIIYMVRGIQSIKIALQNTFSNYFIMTVLMISIYSWISIILFNPNIIMLMLAFSSSGVLIGILVHRQAIPVKDFSFLSDPRNSFFSILGIIVLMACAVSLTYIYIEKFTSIIYFSKGVSANQNTIESLDRSESMLLNAITLDKNDIYYRDLSQVYVSKVNLLINNKDISQDILKSELQRLINLTQQSAELAVTQNPKQYLNYVNLGNVYGVLVPLSVTNSYESAMTAYDKALALSPNNPSILLAKASLEFINKNNTEARKYIKQALDLKKNYTDAIFLLVQIETNEGNLSEAIKQAEYAGEVSPNDPTVFFRLGLLRYNSSDYTGAISAFEKAVILDNGYLNARYYLGQSYKKVGRSSDALVQFNLLNKIAPDNQDIKDAISSINEPTPKVDDKTTTTDSKTKPPLKEKQ
ncbi:MAG: tetratricopeptide repeat protein, partial [Bacteroidetes bacterium]|nr:tetratricopeptide repeat protein [Bacteroidota bacterium]